MTVVLAIFGLVAVGLVLLHTMKGGGMAHSISLAIGVAEGGYDASGNNLNNGTLPSRNHNPGDLTIDGTGKAIGMNGSFQVYSSDADGYAALDYQVNLWLNGESANATADSTIAEISSFYTDTDPAAWASNVAAVLGVSVDTPIGQIGQSSPSAPSSPVSTDQTDQVASDQSDGGDISG